MAAVALLAVAPGARGDGPPRLAAPPPPRAARPSPAVFRPAEELAVPPPPAPRSRWRGPRVAVGWDRWALADGFGGGAVDSLFLDGVVRFARPVRVTLGLDWGLRSYAFGEDDLVGRARAGVGWELVGALGPVVPHVSLVGSLGMLVANRFSVTEVELLGGGGVELGADVALAAPLFVGLAFGWQRIRLRDDGYDAWSVRVRAGL